MNKKLVRLLALPVTLPISIGVVASCGPGSTPNRSVPAVLRTSPVELTANARYEKFCIDPTRSSSVNFAPEVVQAIASSIGTWAAAPSSRQPTVAVRPIPSLSAWIRTVGTNSFGTDSQSLEVQIPGIPGLPAPPSIDDPTLATDQVTWANSEAQWAAAVRVAHIAASLAAAQIRNLKLNQSPYNMSAIWQCMAALAGSGPQNPPTRMTLASDLQNNEPAIAANYAGSPILIVQSCPSDADASCVPLAASWTARLKSQGAGPISFVRADAAAQAIQSWILGERS